MPKRANDRRAAERIARARIKLAANYVIFRFRISCNINIAQEVPLAFGDVDGNIYGIGFAESGMFDNRFFMIDVNDIAAVIIE